MGVRSDGAKDGSPTGAGIHLLPKRKCVGRGRVYYGNTLVRAMMMPLVGTWPIELVEARRTPLMTSADGRFNERNTPKQDARDIQRERM
jgi:hypothetical protein